MRNALLATVTLALGCGRTLPYECQLVVAPTELNYGNVAVGASATQSVTLSSLLNGGCHITALALTSDTDPGFSLANGELTDFWVPAQQSVSVPVTFTPTSTAPPLKHTGTLAFQTGDPTNLSASVALLAQVPACVLTVSPASVDFGDVSLDVPATQTVTLSNSGTLPCDVSDLALAAGSDPDFSLPSTASFSVAPGAQAEVQVDFLGEVSALPFTRTSTLTFDTGDQSAPTASVPLSATLPKCTLGWTPASVNFGNVPLNGSRAGTVTLTNDGGVACQVSALALAPGTDTDFLLPAQPTSFTVDPGASATVAVDFNDLSGATPPLTHTGTLTFDTGDLTDPTGSVPLTAFIATACSDGGQWIYTVDGVTSVLSAFHPDTLTFDDLGVLNCPAPPGYSPFSMGVDQSGAAWVLYSEGGNTAGQLFQVDTTTLACQATSYQPDQDGFSVFGMGFSFQPTTDIDTLFIAGGASVTTGSVTLGTIAFPSLTVSTVASLPIFGSEGPELTGTGDGQLWGFVPGDSSPEMVQIDTTTGASLTTYPLTPLIGNPEDWAVGFYGGAFWAFLASDNNGGTTTVYEIQRADGTITIPLPDTGRNIVGAGVSTCAPLE